jgi:hypothetical protein
MALLPQRATWVATANNVELGGDMVRRCYWIRLNAKMATPWRGRTFQHPDLLGWVRGHRGEILGALLTLSRAWFAAGCPKAETPTLGKFEAWCETVGGVLALVGDKNFLGNLDTMQVSLSESDGQWEGFLRGIREIHEDAPFLASDLVEDLKNYESLELPDDLTDAFDPDQGTHRNFSRKLGKALSKHQDIRYGDDGICLTRVEGDKHRGAARWRVHAG